MKRLPRLLSIFLAAITILSALAYAGTWAVVNLHHRNEDPYDFTILNKGRYIVDLLCFVDRFRYLHHQHFFDAYPGAPFNYPPPVTAIYRLFYMTGAHPEIWFFVVTLSCIAFAAVLFTKALTRRGLKPASAVIFTAGSVLLSYPFLFALTIANLELIVWIILALGIYLFLKGYGWQAAILFGLAGSMKYFPLIFVALPLAQRRYRDALLVIIAFAASLSAAAWWMGPTLGAVVQGLRFQTLLFKQIYINHFHGFENSIDHSLFGLGKYALYTANHLRSLPRLAPFYLVGVALLGTALWLFRIRKLPIINQVLALSVASVLLPPVSHDYTLMHLYAPWAMLVLACLSIQRKGMWLAFTCFAFLFTPQSYLIYHSVRFAGQFKAVVLLVLFVTSLVYPFEDLFEDRRPDSASAHTRAVSA